MMWRIWFVRWHAKRALRFMKKMNDQRLYMWSSLDHCPSLRCKELADITLRTPDKTINQIERETLLVLDETRNFSHPHETDSTKGGVR